MYFVMIIALFGVLPVASVIIESLIRRRRRQPSNLLVLVGTWFTFWAVGVRLFTVGISQTLTPEYTAESIFGITDPVVLPFVEELGFANLAMGTLALLSIVHRAWTTPAAIIGAIYFGSAGFRHLLEGGDFTDLRVTAMVSDLLVFAVLAFYLAGVAVRRLRGGRRLPALPNP